MTLPKKYSFLKSEPGPKMLIEALKHYGVLEHRDSANNPDILKWATEIGGWVGNYFRSDSIPWCGLFMGIVAKRSGYAIPNNPLSALAWASFGVPVKEARLGYVLVFTRSGGGHVGLYVGEDAAAYHVLGGNQSNAVNITRIAKSRLYSIQRPKYKIGEPSNVRKILLSASGVLSVDER